MKRLQEIKFEVLSYCSKHPEVRLRDICKRFRCSLGWLKNEREKAGLLRERGRHLPSYTAASRIATHTKKRDRLQRELADVSAKIAALEEKNV